MRDGDDFGVDDFDDEFSDGTFDELIGMLREGPIELTDEVPSAGLWTAIASELGLAAVSDQTTPIDVTLDSLAARTNFDIEAIDIEAIDIEAIDIEAIDETNIEAIDETNVVSFADRRPAWGRPVALLTLAAAVVLLLAVPIGLSLRSNGDTQVIAAAELDLLEGQTGTAVDAELVSIGGDLVLEVDAPTQVGDGEFLELWLLEVGDDGVRDLASLGRVDDSGRYDVPDDVDLERFNVVDISVELDDGNPDHSGVSVVRGELG